MIATNIGDGQSERCETQSLLPTGLKKCRQCGIEAHREMFKKSKDYKDGYSSLCKKCHNKKNKSYRRDKEKEKLNAKKWRENNPQKVKEIQRESNKKRWESGKIQEYREKNKDKYLATRREWREKNKEKENQRTIDWKKNNTQKIRESNRKSKEKRKDENLRLSRIWTKKSIQELNDWYVKSILRRNDEFTTEQINNNTDLIEVKRLILKIKRL